MSTKADKLGQEAEPATAPKKNKLPAYEIPRAPSGVLKFEPFPIDVYPPKVREFCKELCDSIEGGLDYAFAGVALLPIAGAAVGNTYWVEVKEGQEAPSVVWAGIVGASGSGKTPMLENLWAPLTKLETQLALSNEAAFEEWERGDKTTPPPKPSTRYTIDDITSEAAMELVKRNPFGVLMAKDEGAGFFESFGLYKSGGAGADRTRWLSVWGAGKVVVDRIGRRAPMIPSMHVSMIAGFQPGILARVLTPEMFESGLVARFALVAPPEPSSKWNGRVVPADLRTAYSNAILRLLGIRELEGSEPFKRRIIKNLEGSKAREVLVAFKNAHGDAKKELEPELQASWQKLGEYAFRFALILELLWWAEESTDPDPPKVLSERSARGAIRLVQFFANESRRLFRDLHGTDSEKLLGKVLETFATHGPMTARNFDRLCPARLRGPSKKEHRKRWLAELLESGQLVTIEPGPGQRKERIALPPEPQNLRQ